MGRTLCFYYAPWLIANITIKALPGKEGASSYPVPAVYCPAQDGRKVLIIIINTSPCITTVETSCTEWIYLEEKETYNSFE